METTLPHFLDELASVRWFANLGKPSPRDPEVFRIHDWLAWPGPEDPGSEMLAAYNQKRKDDLFARVRLPSGFETQAAWDAIHAPALQAAKARVPYDEAGDAWDGPTAAAWCAASCAALVGCRRLLGGAAEQPASGVMQWTLENEWSWFVAGHWPCMYYWPWGHAGIEVAERTGMAKRLVVY
jgi:hypothetical protein